MTEQEFIDYMAPYGTQVKFTYDDDVIHHSYLCEETNERFTTTELDELNLKELENEVNTQKGRSN